MCGEERGEKHNHSRGLIALGICSMIFFLFGLWLPDPFCGHTGRVLAMPGELEERSEER